MSLLQDKLAWPRKALLALALGWGLGELCPLPSQRRPQALAGSNPPTCQPGAQAGAAGPGPRPPGRCAVEMGPAWEGLKSQPVLF